ncbi:hypothetical protein MPSEU_000485900 [Mayamaea pseudoterrestris]|nr:hypothetical protein MPSEU_000485900 [Mayamaea pseudoterrestris]
MCAETGTTPSKDNKETDLAIDDGAVKEWKKYSTYSIAVDPDQGDKATEIKMFSFARPHMRAFHCSWWSFFIAFLIWFAIAPLLKEIGHTLNLSKQELWTSNIVSVAGTIFMRFLLGPLCDKLGAKALFSLVLISASIPTACLGFVNSASGLYVLRLFIGIAGGSFVTCQYWSSMMFTKDIVGTVNGITAGWGNLGGGVTHLVVGSALFPLFKNVFFDGDAEMAWRTVCVVPAAVATITGVVVYFISEDCPKGNYNELTKHGSRPEVSATASFRSGAINMNSWLLFIQYGCCFGVELTMYNAAALYFADEFGLSTEKAALVASIFGWLNICARGLGGYFSDRANAKMGMRGRLLIQTLLLAVEGALVLVFGRTKSLAGSIIIMTTFSLLVQAANGSTFGIVPYVDPSNTGSVSGIVGAGGNFGAVCFGLGFRSLSYEKAFTLMGALIMGSSLLSGVMSIKGHRGLFCGTDDNPPGATLIVPEKDIEGTSEDINSE